MLLDNMSNSPIDRRLEEITKSGVMHSVTGGNSLPKKDSMETVGDLGNGVMEVIIQDQKVDPFKFIKVPADRAIEQARILAKAMGKPETNIATFLLSYSERIKVPGYEFHNFETHAFYDPRSDLTHYFLLPARHLIEEH